LLAAFYTLADAWSVFSADIAEQRSSDFSRGTAGDFGPVLAAMTSARHEKPVELANNTVYGLAACVWSESINVSLHVAAQLKAGVVWVNCTNLFDALAVFGGYRESGFGREGGREGLLEYLEPVWFKQGTASSHKAAGHRSAAGAIR